MKAPSLGCLISSLSDLAKLSSILFIQESRDHRMLSSLFQRIPYSILIPAAILLGLAPFSGEPHLIEKVRLIFQGVRLRAIDIFDLCLHSAPSVLLIGKILSGRLTASRGHNSQDRTPEL